MSKGRDDWKKILQTNHMGLLSNIDTENGLYGELNQRHVFTDMKLSSCWQIIDPIKRIGSLLDGLQIGDKERFDLFCQSLEASGQAHVVKNYLTKVRTSNNMKVDPDDVDGDNPQNRPLSNIRKDCLQHSHNELIQLINFDEAFAGELSSRNAFTEFQMTSMKSINDSFKRNEKMLILIKIGSEKRWNDWCEALLATHQDHIVKEYLSPSDKTYQEVKPSELVGSELSKEMSELNIVQNRKKFEDQPAEMIIEFSKVPDGILNAIKEKVKKKTAYPINGKFRGRAVIINNENFEPETRLPNRTGANFDAKNLRTLFEKLRFDCEVYSDKTAKGIKTVLEDACSWKHHKESDCFVLCLLSHGEEGCVFGTDKIPVYIKEIWTSFSGKECPDLIGKPKIFFIQACQGVLKTTGVAAADGDGDGVTETTEITTDSWEELSKGLGETGITNDMKMKHETETDAELDVEHKIHEMADMLIAYSVVDGYAAYRRKDLGSLYVRCLVDIISNHAHEDDLQSMLTQALNKLQDMCIQMNQQTYVQLAKKEDTLTRPFIYLLPEGRHHSYKLSKEFDCL